MSDRSIRTREGIGWTCTKKGKVTYKRLRKPITDRDVVRMIRKVQFTPRLLPVIGWYRIYFALMDQRFRVSLQVPAIVLDWARERLAGVVSDVEGFIRGEN